MKEYLNICVKDNIKNELKNINLFFKIKIKKNNNFIGVFNGCHYECLNFLNSLLKNEYVLMNRENRMNLVDSLK